MAAPSGDGLYATLQTTAGEICFELYYTNVPQTVANFIGLAEGSRPWIDPRTTFVSQEPFYNGIIFHRVISGFMIQAGSPNGTGSDGPGYTIQDEFVPELRHDQPGRVSMANSGPDSNGGQFFITVDSTPHLDDVHSVFGNVVEGLSVVSAIANTTVDANNRPLTDITITNVLITRNGTDAQNFAVTNQGLPEVAALPLSITGNPEIKLTTGTATSSFQYVYSSTNLSDWTQDAQKYWPVPDGNWELTVSPEAKGFFRANQVVYRTVNTNLLEDVTQHHLTMTMEDGLVIQITPESDNSGRAQYGDEAEDQIVLWEWNKNHPYRMEIHVETDFPDAYVFYLYYSTPTNGRCTGYYYDSEGGWQSLGKGTFTDQDLN